MFYLTLAKKIGCDLCFDIGSLDGNEATLMSSVLPKAMVVCFEPNRLNHEKLKNKIKRFKNIKFYPFAISSFNGEGDFYIDNPLVDNNPGTSSLRKRKSEFYRNGKLVQNPSKVIEIERVPVHRLDDFVIKNFNDYKNIALWIDVEGLELEVLRGIGKIKERIKLIHLEIETWGRFEGGSKEREVLQLTGAYGFKLIGNNKVVGGGVYDGVFLQTREKVPYRSAYFKSYIWNLIKRAKIQKFLRTCLNDRIYNKIKYFIVRQIGKSSGG